MTDLGATSARLKDVAADAFHGHVLPAIRREVPGLDQRIATLVTSSVAYGSADAYSDLDVFIMFRRDKDYRLWAPDLERIIESLELDAIYGDVCDKGIRFELESLHRSDLAGLFFHPYDLRRWERQTEWLLSWFLSATPIYDPAGLWLEMHKRCGTWPPPIRHQRQQVARLVARRAAAVAARTDPHDWDLPTLHRIWQGLAASVDLAYLLDGTYAPHPKWRQPLARQLLTEPRSHQLLDAFDTALTAISQPGDTATALAELEATATGLTSAEDVSSPASAESFCWAARRDGHTTWVQHR